MNTKIISTQSEFLLFWCAVALSMLLSGCLHQSAEQQINDTTTNVSVVPAEPSSTLSENSSATHIQNTEAQERRDPKLEKQSRWLREMGIDCSHENTYGTRNSLAIDPKSPNILYIGVEGRGMYKSTDRGRTWKKIVKGLVAYPDMNNKAELCFPDIAAIYIDPEDSRKLLMVTADITSAYVDWPYGETGGIWESFDRGESWRQMITRKMNVAGSGNLALDPKNTKIMYYPVNPDFPSFTEAPIKESLNKKGSVYKTTDGGISWEELEMPMLPSLQAIVIAIDPQDSNHILFLTQSHDHIYGESTITEVFLHQQHAILESFDAGRTWNTLGDTLPDPYRTLFDGDVSKNNFKHMIVRPFLFGEEFPPETTQQKSFFSTDGGKTFAQTSVYIWTGRYDPHDTEGKHLLGYAPWQGWVVESRDAGKTWKSLSSPEEVSGYAVKISNFVWDPNDPDLVYMSGEYANIWQSFDGGKTWANILDMDKVPK